MQPDVGLEPFRLYQVPLFLANAKKEGWRCEEWEFRFVLHAFPAGCWVARNNGRLAGFVTSIKYGSSGWIGNLLVRQKERGQGFGRRLMERAIDSLAEACVSTIWLTASEAGRPLYEKLGFVAVDHIVRWSGRGTFTLVAGGRTFPKVSVSRLDQAGWGDDRSLIINLIAGMGTVLETAGGFCMVQTAEGGYQLGPWGSENEVVAGQLLQLALGTIRSAKVFLDAPESNQAAARVLTGAGFVPCGRTVLMYRGATPAYQPELVYALASMGSMG